MAYISPSTQNTGHTVTAAEWNQDVVDNAKASAPDAFTAKGDLFVGTGADEGAVLPAGEDGQVLMLDSGEPTGQKWASRLSGRQGGDAADWTVVGTIDYTPSAVRMQCGSRRVTIANGEQLGDAPITFPVAFSNAPIIVGGLSDHFDAGANLIEISFYVLTASGFEIYARREETTGGEVDVDVFWLAIGPA